MNQSVYDNINTSQLVTPKAIPLPKFNMITYLIHHFSVLFFEKNNNVLIKNSIKLFFILFLFVLGAASAQAQDDFVEDPMGKSAIWQQLTENPTDSTLWENYYGKPWASMNKKEAEKVNGWKQELMLRKLASNDAVIGFVITDEIDEGFFIDEAAFREFEAEINAAKASGQAATVSFKDIQGLEAIIMPEWEGMAELKQNVAENFVILEDMYKDIFDEQGLEFQNYTAAHPDGKYSQVKWIEELDGKLRKAKEKQLSELKQKFNINK
ncbi:hypothetical protein [Bernardetia sp.]|uniref:hypothetical protein n=1 Tax=Bernardetia sp. TaxID=1937974 RepID=UPI0025BC6E7E|nr:hypothetical protein [Bernardetia sp.]